MKVIRGLHNLKPNINGCVLTIGNFDGVHLGHQTILKKLTDRARELSVPACVMIFEPQPAEFFAKVSTIPSRLMRWSEKITALQSSHIDQVLIVRFNKKFSSLSAEEFVKQILVDKLHVKAVLIGDDFRFGSQRDGDFDFLKKMGMLYHFSVEDTKSITHENARISSTIIRNALASGDHVLAEKLLGHPYKMTGRVVHGDQLGRVLGFPTANILLKRAASPVHGIYVVRVYGIDNKTLLGVANVGTRPAVNGTRMLLEVYLFNFSKDIYGRRVSVEFSHKLRDEEYYENLELLKNQITIDVEQARQYFIKTGELHE
ncbi:MAG: bifunctional riboflavin kinase/FAD synthetase [Gammaproteobacteria bacterium]|nr:bifunctional riboflavin kinase/FAD synthetase [Gammaproteobacteria bacterium]